MLSKVDYILILNPEVCNLTLVNYDVAAFLEVDICIWPERIEKEFCYIVLEKECLLTNQDPIK